MVAQLARGTGPFEPLDAGLGPIAAPEVVLAPLCSGTPAKALWVCGSLCGTVAEPLVGARYYDPVLSASAREEIFLLDPTGTGSNEG
jgi:hypothetical protein